MTEQTKKTDKAFHSRISVAIKYEDLAVDSRTQIWTTLLQVANISGIDPAELCAYDINGCALSSIFGLLFGWPLPFLSAVRYLF